MRRKQFLENCVETSSIVGRSCEPPLTLRTYSMTLGRIFLSRMEGESFALGIWGRANSKAPDL